MPSHRLFELSAPVDLEDHIRGRDEAAVTIVEYGNFQCPRCKQAASAIRIILGNIGGEVRLVYRHFPQPEIHPLSELAALATEAANRQGQFWGMHDVLFERSPKLERQHLDSYARDLALDMDRFAQDMGDQTLRQKVDLDFRSGLDSGVRATPTFYINGHIADVSGGLQQLHTSIERVLRS